MGRKEKYYICNLYIPFQCSVIIIYIIRLLRQFLHKNYTQFLLVNNIYRKYNSLCLIRVHILK